jgi:hypothetical protein
VTVTLDQDAEKREIEVPILYGEHCVRS